MSMSEELSVGDRIRLSGGYEIEPAWLQGRQHHTATITGFIPGQNHTPAVVAHLDALISVDQIVGEVVVLELRYKGARWDKGNTVHIELCDFEPESKPWKDRRQGMWIESHATCEKL